MVNAEIFRRHEIVLVKEKSGEWVVLEITSKNNCTLKEQGGPEVVVRGPEKMIKIGA